jgi:hypothetical protein
VLGARLDLNSVREAIVESGGRVEDYNLKD